MKTKICRGSLHPEGVELPIDNFILSSRRKVLANGNIKIYYSYRKLCKKCSIIKLMNWVSANPVKVKIAGAASSYRWAKKNKDKMRILYNKQARKNKAKKRSYFKNYRRETRLSLAYSYVKSLWDTKFKRRGLEPPEFTRDIWLAESIRIQAIRDTRKPKTTE